MNMDELRQFCDNEFRNIDQITDELMRLYQPGRDDYSLQERAAMAAFIVNIYGGIEKILKQMLIFDRLDVKDSPEWHEKILKKAGEIGILPPELFQVLSRYLAFRNYFLYSYIFNIRWEDMRVMVDAMKDVIEKIRKEVYEYIDTI